MRTTLLIAAAGVAGMMALPGAARAQGWRGYGYYRPYPPPLYGPPFYEPRIFYRPRPFYPPPFYRPRVFYPPPLLYAPPPPVAYVPPVYVTPRVTHRSRVVHRAVHRAAVPCSCVSRATPAAAGPSLPGLRPAPSTPAAPAPSSPPNNVYPPERSP